MLGRIPDWVQVKVPAGIGKQSGDTMLPQFHHLSGQQVPVWQPIAREGLLQVDSSWIGCSLEDGQPLWMNTYEMASIMSMPISTQQWAWSALASGSPETQ